MANIINQYGQVKVGVRSNVLAPISSSLWASLYSAYNADSIGSSSLKTSLVAAYNGESNANDSFGANNGTAVGGLTYTAGKIGNAFQFNGTTSYVSISNTTNQFNFDGDFSISLWVNYNTTAASVETFFSNLNPSNGYAFYTEPTKISFDLYSPSANCRFTVPFSPSINTWYHMVVTRKRSTETKIYLNGVLQSGTYVNSNPTVNQTYQANQEYRIGSYISSSPLLSNIKIDGLGIWSKELTQAEVTELYNSGNGAQYITDNFYKPTPNDALNTYNGTAQGGLTYGVGKVGTAFQFNGTNAYVSLGNDKFNFTGNFSISGWINLNSVSGNQCILSNLSFVSPNVSNGFLLLMRNQKLYLELYQNNNTYIPIASNTNFNTSTWYHISIVRVASQSTKIYINGVLDNSNSSTYNPTYSSSIPIPSTIGAWKYDSTNVAQYTNGRIDALNIWNRELTQSEITELYNTGNGKQYTI